MHPFTLAAPRPLLFSAPRLLLTACKQDSYKPCRARAILTSLVCLQVGAVSHIDFSPVYPFHYAVTSSTRVIIYDAFTRQARLPVAGWLLLAVFQSRT